jgi:hypothetical protein
MTLDVSLDQGGLAISTELSVATIPKTYNDYADR